MVLTASSSANCRNVFQRCSGCSDQWPPDITANVISKANLKGMITNSDLELVGLMEHVCGPLDEKCIALFSYNSPTVSWVQ